MGHKGKRGRKAIRSNANPCGGSGFGQSNRFRRKAKKGRQLLQMLLIFDSQFDAEHWLMTAALGIVNATIGHQEANPVGRFFTGFGAIENILARLVFA